MLSVVLLEILAVDHAVLPEILAVDHVKRGSPNLGGGPC